MDMKFSKLHDIVEDRRAWCVAVPRIGKSRTQLSCDWTKQQSTFLEPQESGRIYSRPHYHKLLLEILIFILERAMKTAKCVYIQQLLERVCGEAQSLGHLLTVVVSCLLHGCWVLTLGQSYYCILQTRNWSTVDGIYIGLHQRPQPWITYYIVLSKKFV